MKIFQKGCLVVFLLLLVIPESASAIERRKPQFQTEPAYLVFPIPYSLPGIGEGLMLSGLGLNMFETNTDIYVIYITGDVSGSIVGLMDVHLLPETLILDVMDQRLDKAMVNIYEKRGMDTEKDDYMLAEVDKVYSQEASLTLTLFDRRFELLTGIRKQDISLVRFRDKDANIIPEMDFSDDPIQMKSESSYYGALLDITDDYSDPRQGGRLSVTRSNSPPGDSSSPDFYTWDYSLGLYFPVGEQSTWMFNIFQSHAQVVKEGETDLDVISQTRGCISYDTCTPDQKAVVDSIYAGNKYGTATSLGGQQRLRSYSMGRYQGAHTLFYGTEFRWNMTEESTPFDYFIWKDVRTSMQLAFFYETGTVAETRDALGEIYRSSYGTGFRMVSASGLVYRADYAMGSEGNEMVVMFFYPY